MNQETRRQRGLNLILGAFEDMDAEKKRQESLIKQAQKEKDARSMQAFGIQQNLASQGIETDPTAFNDYIEKGDTSSLSNILKPVAAQAIEQRQYERAQREAQRKMQGEGASLDRKMKEAQLAELQRKTAQGPEIKADQYKVGGFAKRALMAEQDLSKLPANVGTGKWTDTIQGNMFFPEAMKSGERKQFEQAQRNFISAVLRRESGAAISDQEMENESKKYFPQPGDTQQVLAQKKAARDQAVNNLRAEAGGAMTAIADAPPAMQQPQVDNGLLINNAVASDPKKAQETVNSMNRNQLLQFLGM